jgi:hypothetical protein
VSGTGVLPITTTVTVTKYYRYGNTSQVFAEFQGRGAGSGTGPPA